MTPFALCPTIDKISHQNHGLEAPSAAFRLRMPARKRSRKPDGQKRLPEIIQRAEFRNGFHQLQAVA